jgi:hypothetical protein
MTYLTPHSRSLRLDSEHKTLAIRHDDAYLEMPRAEVAQMMSFLMAHPTFFEDQPAQMRVFFDMLADSTMPLKCNYINSPIQSQSLCHTSADLAHDRKYLARLKEHAGFFVAGALWSSLIVFLWAGLGAVSDLSLAACLLGFFWFYDLVHFFNNKRDLNIGMLKARIKKKRSGG